MSSCEYRKCIDVCSIRDTDGEFLLIEAADELPSWVTPDNAPNRVSPSSRWKTLDSEAAFSSGCEVAIYILSLSSIQPSSIRKAYNADDDDETPLDEDEALKAVRTGQYRAEAVETAVWRRVDNYPAALSKHTHRTNAYLPKQIAKALSVRPDLIQRAVEAFYVRDPSQLRSASRMTHFPPSPATLTSVVMTRPAFVQLRGQLFPPTTSFWS